MLRHASIGVCFCAGFVMLAGNALGETTFSSPFIKITAECQLEDEFGKPILDDRGLPKVSRAERTFSPSSSWSFPGGHEWQLDASLGPVVVTDDSGNQIFTINELGIAAHNFPMVVNNNFNVSAGFGLTTFTITSGTLAFTSFGSASAFASAGITVTDTGLAGGSGGATLTGLYAGGTAYRAMFNDTDPSTLINGSLFSSIVTGGTVALNSSATFSNPGVSGPIAGSVFNMVSEYKFSVTRLDLASGTSTYQIIPSPAAASLLGLGSLLVARRRRDVVSR